MSIFIRQLLSRLPELPPSIEASYDKCKSEQPGHEALIGFLLSMPDYYASLGNRQVFIVCDALDETDEHNQRQELLPLFHELKASGFKMFLTSRPHPADVRLSFSDAIQLDVIPDAKDLRHYVHDRLVNNFATQRIINRSGALSVEDVVASIVESTEGM
jgi:hypothetical protein